MTLLIVAATLAATSGAAAAKARDPGPTAVSTSQSTPIAVRTVSTEQVRAMAATGTGKLITFSPTAGKAGNAVTAASVNCYMGISLPYGGGGYNTPIAIDGWVYCDDYVHVAVLTLELFRGTDRVANTTATFPYVSGIYATAVYPTCSEGVYFGIVGVTVARYDLTPPSITSNQVSYPVYIGCASAPPPPPPPATLAVTNPGNQSTLDGNTASLQMNATGGTTPYTWSATNLPTGLSINPSTGLISGTTAPRAGSFPVTVTVTDAASRTASTNFTWTVRRDACPRC